MVKLNKKYWRNNKMMPFEENMRIWNDTLEEISHPIYKSI